MSTRTGTGLRTEAIHVWASTTRGSVKAAIGMIDSILAALSDYGDLPSVCEEAGTAAGHLVAARGRMLSVVGAVDRIVEMREREAAVPSAEGER